MLQQHIKDFHGILLDACVDVGHGTGEVGTEEREKWSHSLRRYTLRNEPGRTKRVMRLLLFVNHKMYVLTCTVLHLLQHSRCGRTNVVTFVCENSRDFREQTREMLLQQRGVGGQQLSQTQQGTVLHIVVVMVKL